MISDNFYFRLIRRKIHSIIRAFTIAINGILFFATVFSAYGGWFDPVNVPVAALAAMILPVLLVLDIIVIVIDCFVSYRIAVMIIAALVISAPEIQRFSPLHFFHTRLTPQQEARSFTLLTYNCQHFVPYHRDPREEPNRMVDYILGVDADVVNLQEVEYITERKDTGVTKAQADTIAARYPYRLVNVPLQLTVLSKFPLDSLHITIPRRNSPCYITAFKLDVHGTEINLYNVHMKSIGLSTDDKTLFRQIPGKIKNDTGELREELRDVKEKLVSKLAASFVVRGVEARWLRQVIDSVGGNTIVAGDFNDIQGSHAQRIIMNGDLHDAYRENALGPWITYHDNFFYFRIDHILYGGDLKAVSITRDTPPWSDHYPLLTRILITD